MGREGVEGGSEEQDSDPLLRRQVASQHYDVRLPHEEATFRLEAVFVASARLQTHCVPKHRLPCATQGLRVLGLRQMLRRATEIRTALWH